MLVRHWKGDFVRSARRPSSTDGVRRLVNWTAERFNRLRRMLPLNAYVRDTLYYGGEEGYADYPFYEEVVVK
ncbi:hypothetical protein V1281_004606 [Nitrobacteraceae bacterium AZCC 2161]